MAVLPIDLGPAADADAGFSHFEAWTQANLNFIALLDAIAALPSSVPLKSVAGLTGTPDAAALMTALGTVPMALSQVSAPSAPASGGGCKVYSRAGSGGSVLEYKTGSSSSQTVTLPGQFGGDTKNAWWTQPMGYGRLVTTGNDTPLVHIKSTLSSAAGTAGFGVPALQVASGIGSTSGSGTATVITPAAVVNTAYGINSFMNIYSSSTAGFHCGHANEVRRKIPGATAATIFAATHVLQDETGFPSNLSGPMNSIEIDLIANGDDPTVGSSLGVRRILSLVYKNTKAADTPGPVTIGAAGSGYSDTAPPPVTITDAGGGTGWTGVCVVVGGQVKSVAALTQGSGYTGPLTVTIGPPGTGGTQATATATLAQPVEIAYGCTLGPSSATQSTNASMKIGFGVGGRVSRAAFDVLGFSQASASACTFIGSGVAYRMGVTNGPAPAGHALGMADGTDTALIGGLSTGTGNITIALKPTGTGTVQCQAPLKLPAYTMTQLPAAASYTGCAVCVSDRDYRMATSNGTAWKFQDGTTVS